MVSSKTKRLCVQILWVLQAAAALIDSEPIQSRRHFNAFNLEENLVVSHFSLSSSLAFWEAFFSIPLLSNSFLAGYKRSNHELFWDYVQEACKISEIEMPWTTTSNCFKTFESLEIMFIYFDPNLLPKRRSWGSVNEKDWIRWLRHFDAVEHKECGREVQTMHIWLCWEVFRGVECMI